jgi:hypothetical protein
MQSKVIRIIFTSFIIKEMCLHNCSHVLKPQDSMEHSLNTMDLMILFQHLPAGTEGMYKILQ